MNSYVNEYEMILPRGYVDLSAEELEYDGTGWLNKLVGALEIVGGGIAIVSLVLSIPATSGTDTILAIGGIISGFAAVGDGIDRLTS
jgi:hypothetical protein